MTTERVRAALYTHGPCSAAAIAQLVGDASGADTAKALAALGAEVSHRAIEVKGWGAVDLLYLRGNGVG